MTIRNPPSWIQQGSHPAVNDRLMTAGLLQRPGPCGPGQMLVTQNTALGLSVLVSAGGCFVRGSDITNQGVYHVFNDAPVSLTVQNPDPSFQRIDAVYAWVQDADSAGIVNLASVGIATGAPNSSPTIPAIPTSAYLLGTIAVPNAAGLPTNQITNAMITNFKQYAMGPGSVINGLTETQLAAYAPQYPGLYADGLDTGRLLRSNGSTFVPVADPASFTGGGSYTPSWTGETAGAGSVGAGAMAGSYRQIGKYCDFNISMLLGTGAGGPSGIYNWSLPVPAPGTFRLGSGVDIPIGKAIFYGGTLQLGIALLRANSPGTKLALVFQGQTAMAQSGNPGTWGVGTRVSMFGRYETA